MTEKKDLTSYINNSWESPSLTKQYMLSINRTMQNVTNMVFSMVSKNRIQTQVDNLTIRQYLTFSASLTLNLLKWNNPPSIFGTLHYHFTDNKKKT